MHASFVIVIVLVVCGAPTALRALTEPVTVGCLLQWKLLPDPEDTFVWTEDGVPFLDKYWYVLAAAAVLYVPSIKLLQVYQRLNDARIDARECESDTFD